MLLLMASQGLVFWIGEGEREERKKERNLKFIGQGFE
jgi:hypothetical protein